MRKIRYAVSMGTPRGRAIYPGDEAEVAEEEALRLAEKGFAEMLGYTTPPAKVDSIDPAGSIRELEEWVGDDAVRAARVLEAERDRPNPRTTLIRKLEGVVGQQDDAQDEEPDDNPETPGE